MEHPKVSVISKLPNVKRDRIKALGLVYGDTGQAYPYAIIRERDSLLHGGGESLYIGVTKYATHQIIDAQHAPWLQGLDLVYVAGEFSCNHPWTDDDGVLRPRWRYVICRAKRPGKKGKLFFEELDEQSKKDGYDELSTVLYGGPDIRCGAFYRGLSFQRRLPFVGHIGPDAPVFHERNDTPCRALAYGHGRWAYAREVRPYAGMIGLWTMSLDGSVHPFFWIEAASVSDLQVLGDGLAFVSTKTIVVGAKIEYQRELSRVALDGQDMERRPIPTGFCRFYGYWSDVPLLELERDGVRRLVWGDQAIVLPRGAVLVGPPRVINGRIFAACMTFIGGHVFLSHGDGARTDEWRYDSVFSPQLYPERMVCGAGEAGTYLELTWPLSGT